MVTITVTPTPTDTFTQTKEELKKKYWEMRLAKRTPLYSHDVINPNYGGSDELLGQFIAYYGSWGIAYQELEDARYSWKGEYGNIATLLRWCSVRLGHTPTDEERDRYRIHGVLPADHIIQNRFGGRKDFAVIYRIAALPAPGTEYKPSQS